VSSAQASGELGSLSGRSKPVNVGVPNWYRPSRLMCLCPSGERRLTSLSSNGDTLSAEFVDRGVLVSSVPQHNGVDNESEGSELVFLSFPVSLPELSTLAVENGPGQGMTAFGAVELREDPPTVGLVVEVGEGVEGLGDAAEFGERGTEGCGSATALKDAQEVGGSDGAGGEAAGDPQ